MIKVWMLNKFSLRKIYTPGDHPYKLITGSGAILLSSQIKN